MPDFTQPLIEQREQCYCFVIAGLFCSFFAAWELSSLRQRSRVRSTHFSTRAPIPVFSTQICFFESIWVARFNYEKSLQICFSSKIRFWQWWMFACDHQVKKALKAVKQNIFSRFHTLKPVSISLSNAVGCLPSSTVSHAIARSLQQK